LRYELAGSNVAFEAGKAIDVAYKGETLNCGVKLDFLVEELVVVELKAVEAIAPVHVAQLLTYLKLSGAPLGLLINFNVPVLKNGIQRVLNKEHEVVDEFNPIEKKRLVEQPDEQMPGHGGS
jgi:GxxExxY protein